jgi:hypothetical protein
MSHPKGIANRAVDLPKRAAVGIAPLEEAIGRIVVAITPVVADEVSAAVAAAADSTPT